MQTETAPEPFSVIGTNGDIGGHKVTLSDEELAFFPSWMFFLLLVAAALALSLDQRWFVLRLIALVVGVTGDQESILGFLDATCQRA